MKLITITDIKKLRLRKDKIVEDLRSMPREAYRSTGMVAFEILSGY